MPLSPQRWTEITPSRFPWEREALEFVRERLPDRDPYLAWSNFEFIADDGSINEVDLLVLTPVGLFLIEIKSRPGNVDGDAATWRWRHDGKTISIDNPLLLAQRKAKKLASLLKRQKAFGKVHCPFLEALVFLSASEMNCLLAGNARQRVCLRDRHATTDADRPARAGIIAAVTNRNAEGLRPQVDPHYGAQVARYLSRAVEQAGIRPAQRSRRIGDYELGRILYEGPNYQDREVTHVVASGVKRRVRLYHLSPQSAPESRRSAAYAVRREFEILEGIQHPGILRALDFKEHELGPALVFDHHPAEIRLDHFLSQYADRLGVDLRLHLLRSIAEAVCYAHGKRLVHRALSPQSILVSDPQSAAPGVQICNWQFGHRRAGSTFAVTRGETVVSQMDELIEDASRVYVAPEAHLRADLSGEQLDVFSLGAMAYFLFSGQPPAANSAELLEKLREGRGLQISAVLDGAGTELCDLIRYSTHPEVMSRIGSAQDFLEHLDSLEKDLQKPAEDPVVNPLEARQGDVLGDGFKVLRQLGSGSTARALLVERDAQKSVLKVALEPELNDRLRAEAEVLAKLRHPFIVELYETLEFAGRVTLRLQHAGDQTLAQRLREEGRLHLDLLQRFGDDLLQVIDWLEQNGIPHRDIKPGNIGITAVGRGDKPHLVLFDFSLSRAPLENIHVGTVPYLDPFLKIRKPLRWDLHAERFAAALTLHEMASAALPRWGDGTSDPAMLDCEVTIDSELFEPAIRVGMTRFFGRALRRDARQRFDNCAEMLREWRRVFEKVDQPAAEAGAEVIDPETLLQGVASDTEVAGLGLSTRALGALDRLQILTVADLLKVQPMRIYQMRGVGNQTRKELGKLVTALQKRFPGSHPEPEADQDLDPEDAGAAVVSIDLLAREIIGREAGARRSSEWLAKAALLGLEPPPDCAGRTWPSQTEIAGHLGLTPGRVGQLVSQFRERWARNKSLRILRDDIAGEILVKAGGVMSAGELSQAVLAARGSTAEDPLRSRQVAAVTRAAVESERHGAEQRFTVRRSGSRVLVAARPELADYALRLGRLADELAVADPLPAPDHVIDALQKVPLPAGAEPLQRARLVRLAAAASESAAVSGRLELYPRHMDAPRALKLAHGALLGTRELTVEAIRQRVASRYPEAQSLPDRPDLDRLLAAAGWELEWQPQAGAGQGAYVSRLADGYSATSSTSSLPRRPTTPQRLPDVTPEVATARQFEDRLQHAVRAGAFLVLSTQPRYIARAAEFLQRFDLDVRRLDALLIKHLKLAAEQAKVRWEVALRADSASKESTDWINLLRLVGRSVAGVEQELRRSERTLLLLHAGLLARYGQMELLERLRDDIGRPGGLHGAWVLVPADEQHDLPMLDGHAVPVISPGQRARIPEEWLSNVHRSANGP